MDNEDIEYLIERLESIIDMMETSKHMAAAKLFSLISLLKGQIEDEKDASS